MPAEFTPEARIFWDGIPDETRRLLLDNVWCVGCGAVRTILEYRGRIEGGDLVLEGKCGTCCEPVARLIERG